MTPADHRAQCIEAMKKAMIEADRFGVPDSFIYSMACAAFDRIAYDDLLAAAKHVIAQADRDTNRLKDGTANRTDECWESYHLLCAAITKAEQV